MPNGFTFKQFSVRHDRCAMKVGTDGVLIGAWARGGRRLLDIGAGTGLVSLMLAQRFPSATVEGLEIDAEAAEQCQENMAASPFADRIRVYASAFQDFVPDAPYDAIVSNPPYFLSGMKNNDESRAAARHSDVTFFKDFFRFSRQWLRPSGEVSLVLPADGVDEVSAEAYLKGMMLCRRVWVRTMPDKPVERCLLSFAMQRFSPPEMEEVCLMDSDGRRSSWYENLTCDFYLH